MLLFILLFLLLITVVLVYSHAHTSHATRDTTGLNCHVWDSADVSRRMSWTHVTTNWKVKWFLSHWLLKPNDSFHFFLPQRARGKQKNDSRDLLTGLSGAARCRLKQPEPEAELAWTGPVVTDWDPTSDARRQRLLLLKVNHCRTATQLLLIFDWLVVRRAVGLRCESRPKGALKGDAEEYG